MNTLMFADDFKDREKEDNLPFIKSFYLTNTVMHSSAAPPGKITRRDQFYGNIDVSSRGFSPPVLSILSNDGTSVSNNRIDIDSGRLLCFTKDGNHIRAGKSSPSVALLSVYAFYAEVLEGSYPDRITVPNLVGTGTFTERVTPGFEKNGLVSGSVKFPGKAISLSTGCTPVVYPGANYKNKNWILPGMTSVDQAFRSLRAMHAVTHVRTNSVDDKQSHESVGISGAQVA